MHHVEIDHVSTIYDSDQLVLKRDIHLSNHHLGETFEHGRVPTSFPVRVTWGHGRQETDELLGSQTAIVLDKISMRGADDGN
ncbi:hypothetical protein PoB_006137800 [Plakobranchus ocellatus]|uniref:Uncharacterized protein n=1 Tax=Plakobranchus ocellatus TaxID=259542 RepID=A0AAV4CSG3_9GAST|nr:hypothetical protein PoB_006137800 [Plakobranchus ocellatus]